MTRPEIRNQHTLASCTYMFAFACCGQLDVPTPFIGLKIHRLLGRPINSHVGGFEDAPTFDRARWTAEADSAETQVH
jgi:hypothetical protein